MSCVNCAKGLYGKNPYEFRRSWAVTTEVQHEESSREETLEREIRQLKEQLNSIQEKLFSADSDADQGCSKRRDPGTSFLGRLRSSIIQREEEEASEHSEPPPYSASGSVQNERLGGTKTVYIRNVQLTLNGQPLDMLDTEEGRLKHNFNI